MKTTDNTSTIKNDVIAELQTYKKFYDQLAGDINHFITPGVRRIGFNIDSDILLSIVGTVDSIVILLEKLRINDAYALVRKYHDSIILNTFIDIQTINNSYLDFNNFVNEWRNDSIEIPRKPHIEINKCKKLEKLNLVINNDESFKEIRDRCNNHMHFNNFTDFVINNNLQIELDRAKYLVSIIEDIRYLFILHFLYLFSINEHYMISNDYFDYRDADMKPPEECKKRVAPFIQRVFDVIVVKYRPDLAKIFKENCSMDLQYTES